ncbi:pectin lyase fold/virulence factor [Geopyxis carbonaria]|nr:pectin lyase fold/virulence factor [Geopyxis carbonaria]
MKANFRPLTILLGLLCAGIVACETEAEIEVYPIGSIYQPYTSDLFEVRANGQEIPIVNNKNYVHGHFGMGPGFATIEVTLIDNNTIDASDIRLSPAKLRMVPTVSEDGTSFTFKLPKDAYLIVAVGEEEIVLVADPLERSPPAAKGTGIYNILTDYNADNTGSATTTTALQRAINDASGNFTSLQGAGFPGSRAIVHVPAGVYLVRNVILRSNVNVYLAPGAVLRFTGNYADYTIHWRKNSQQRDITWWIRTAFNSTNIAVTGRGWVDGNGQYAHDVGRIGNNLLVPIWTTNFFVDGIVFRNSAAWAVTPIHTHGLHMQNVKVLNRLDMGENDGFDIMHSVNATIRHSLAISLDDPYSTKCWAESGLDDISRSWPPGTAIPQSGVLIDDALSWTRCFGFKVGQGVVHNQSNIAFTNSVVYQASVGIGINHRWGTGTVRNVLFRDIDIEDTSLMLENRSSWQALFSQGADGLGGGTVDGVTIADVRVRRPGRSACQLSGMAEDKPIRNVLFRNILMPNRTAPARSLAEINVTAPWYVENVVVR